MTQAGCGIDRQWCKGLTAIASVLTLIIAVQSISAVAQERRIARMEAKNDTIVELKTDMRYVKNDLTEIKLMIRKQGK
jgi:hypothetical protein